MTALSRLAIFRLQAKGRDAFPAAERRYSFSHRLQAGGLRSRAMTSAGGAKDFCSYCRFEAADVRHETSFAATRLVNGQSPVADFSPRSGRGELSKERGRLFAFNFRTSNPRQDWPASGPRAAARPHPRHTVGSDSRAPFRDRRPS